MKLELSRKETTTLIAALHAWRDPAGYLLGEDGTFTRYREEPLTMAEMKSLLGRLAFAMK